MKLFIPPPLLGLIFGGLMWLTARQADILTFDYPGRLLLAWIIAAPAILVEIFAILTFIREKTTVNPMAPAKAATLVETGLYRFSRNPMYVALVAVVAAWGLALGNPLNLIFLTVLVWYLTEFQIKPEEAAMREKFGEQYDRYRARVRRWI